MNENLKELFSKLDVKPVSRVFGLDRGQAIDRFYIERFLNENRKHIRGKVLEVGNSKYTEQFGGDNVEESLVLHVEGGRKGIDIVGNLETGQGIPENKVDCFILTQTLLCTYEITRAAENSLRVLKPGGVLLLTVPGITQISRFDYERWGQYWCFTDQTIKRLFKRFVPTENIEVSTYGNVKVAAAFLYGLALHEIEVEDLNYTDEDYQMLVAAVVWKQDT